MDDRSSGVGRNQEPGTVDDGVPDSGIRELFMQTALPQALTDAQGRFVMANRAYSDLVGYSEVDLLTHTLVSIAHPADADAQQRVLQSLTSGERHLAHTAPRYLRADGAVLRCRVALAVVRDDVGLVRFVHSAVERVQVSDAPDDTAEREPLVVPYDAFASDHLRDVLRSSTSGDVLVMLLRLDGLEQIAAVMGWRGVETAHTEVVSRFAGARGLGIRAIVPVSTTELVLMADTTGSGAMAAVIRAILREPVSLSGFQVPVSGRIGFTTGHVDDDPDTLLRRARVALNHALHTGNPEVSYAAELDAQALHDFALTIEIAHALTNQEFTLHYQAKYELDPLTPVGFEALLRWQHPDRGYIPSDIVVRLAESSGLIVPLTCWVIDTAAEQAAAWRDAGTPTRVAINVAPSMLGNPILPLRLSQAISRHGLPASTLELEITETALATAPNAVAAVRQLADLGYWIHVDDFGTGYSSLAAIRALPLRAIKIDRAFVENLMSDTRDRAVVAAIIDIAHQLGCLVIAEGVEDEATLDLLRILGCDKAQGYFLARPMPADEVGDHLRPEP